MRRIFWLTVGAAVGVRAYRKAAKVAHQVSPARACAGGTPAGAPPLAAAAAFWAASRMARGGRATVAFARDVREGMRLYRLAEPRRAFTLERHADTEDRSVTPELACRKSSPTVKDGR